MIRRDFRKTANAVADNVDIVHVQTPFLAHYWGTALARRTGATLVVSYHTYFEHYFHHYLPLVPKALLKRLARSISRAQLNRVDCVITPSLQMAEALLDYGVTTTIEVLPTGLDLEQFAGGDGKRFRADFGIEPDRPVMLTVGRVAFEKNLDFLIDVLDRVRQSLRHVLFVIAGEGPALGPLKAVVRRRSLEANVRFVGYLGRNAGLLDCYRAADLFVFASRTETQGLVLLEAMAVGTPAVSTAVMGTKAVLADAPGAVIANEDVTEFAAAVAALLVDSGRRRLMGAAAAADVARRWSGPTMAARLLDLYRRLVAERPARTASADRI